MDVFLNTELIQPVRHFANLANLSLSLLLLHISRGWIVEFFDILFSLEEDLFYFIFFQISWMLAKRKLIIRKRNEAINSLRILNSMLIKIVEASGYDIFIYIYIYKNSFFFDSPLVYI